MTKQAFSVAQEDAQVGRELVPAGALEEMPTHVKARPIPRISIQAFCENASTATMRSINDGSGEFATVSSQNRPV